MALPFLLLAWRDLRRGAVVRRYEEKGRSPGDERASPHVVIEVVRFTSGGNGRGDDPPFRRTRRRYGWITAGLAR